MLNVGELATAAQEQVDMLLLVMNDRGYGVIRNIQDARFGGRKYYVDLHTPQFADLARSLGWRHTRLDDVGQAGAVRSEEHTSELQSLMRISYAVFCLKKKKLNIIQHNNRTTHNYLYSHTS